MIPSLGRIVHLRLSASYAPEINQRRADGRPAERTLVGPQALDGADDLPSGLEDCKILALTSEDLHYEMTDDDGCDVSFRDIGDAVVLRFL